MALHLGLFHDSEYGGGGIARSWLQKAEELGRRHGWQAEFDRFLALWTSFNAWGMCVSLAQTDAQMLRALKADRQVIAAFDRVADLHGFDELVRSVEDSFPLASFSDLIRLDPRFPWRGERNAEYWRKIAAAGRQVRVSPSLNHQNVNFADTVDCMYMVRCNLVHGGKMANRHEARFVGTFAEMLERLLTNPSVNFLDLR